MLPVLGGEVVERQQRIEFLSRAIGSSLVFDLVGHDKGFQCLRSAVSWGDCVENGAIAE